MPSSSPQQASPLTCLGYLAVVAVLGLAGCANGSSTPLPDLTPDPRKLLTKEEQAKAIADMSVKKDSGRTDVLKDAERR